MMTYQEILSHAYKKLKIKDFEDYRPAFPLYVEQLKEPIPNAIVIWLKSGEKVIYIGKEDNKVSED